MTATTWLDLIGCDVRQTWYDVGGVRIRAIEAGEGQPVVMLHGGGGHAEAYSRNITAHAKHFRTLAIDMVGHGFSDAPASMQYTTDEFIDFMIRFFDVAGIDRAHVSGESFGGRVAAWLAIRHPDRVDRLVLNTNGGLPPRTTQHAEDVEVLLSRTTAALRDPSEETVRARLGWLFANPADVPDELVDLRMAMYSQPAVSEALQKLFSRVFDPVDQQHYVLSPERLRTVKAQTLVIWTDHNPIFDIADARHHLQHIPDVEFRLIKDAGHWPQYEQADIFNEMHVNFLLGRDY